MAESIFAWSSQVSAALIGVVGLVVATVVTLYSVGRQIRANREMAHEDRFAERLDRFGERQYEAAAAYGKAVFWALHGVGELANRRALDVLERRDAERNELLDAFNRRLQEIALLLGEIAMLFGSEEASPGSIAIKVHMHAMECEQSAAFLSKGLSHLEEIHQGVSNTPAAQSGETPEARRAARLRELKEAKQAVEANESAFDIHIAAARETLACFYSSVRKNAVFPK